ncbi:hypothetical protein CPBF1521_01250 [Xanthomonas arboricola pv. juglandis]|nr:hypothetical protein CPBF1521_01250 [Xanthomonas arboricola pv. juglandis]SYZ58111.1 hypothetical protein CPBF427_01950 [Xanthomonas arboricola pv. juglandis]
MDRIITARRVVLALTMLCLLACEQGVAAKSMRSGTGKARHPPALSSGLV